MHIVSRDGTDHNTGGHVAMVWRSMAECSGLALAFDAARLTPGAAALLILALSVGLWLVGALLACGL